MGVAGILLTGGGSTRMGTPKAQLSLEPGISFGVGLALVLSSVSKVVVECGSGVAGVECVTESEIGAGPARGTLDALVALWGRRDISHFVVLGCDYPVMTADALSWLLAVADGKSAIVSLEGHRQFLPMVVTRAGAANLVDGARSEIRSLASFFERLSDGVVIEESRVPLLYRGAFADCDTPADHFRILGRWPGSA